MTQNDDQQKVDLEEKLKEAHEEAQKKEEDAQEAVSTTESPSSELPKIEESKIKELTEALARTMADLQNFKRRSEEEKNSFVKFANANLLRALLPLIDNLGRSVQHLPKDLEANEWAKGIVHIYNDLLKTLETLGVKRIKTVGERLDPKRHEALLSGSGEKDVIIEEFEAGYEMNGEVIKPARVKVGDGTEASQKG